MGSRFMLQNNKMREPVMFDRLKNLMHRLTDHTVLADLLDPISRALARVRHTGVGRTLPMADFIALGVLRQLQGMPTLREQVQSLLHLEPQAAARGPLARSTWSDALASPGRQAVLAGVVPALVKEAAAPRSPGGDWGSGGSSGAGHRWHLPGRKRSLRAPHAPPRRGGQPQGSCLAKPL